MLFAGAAVCISALPPGGVCSDSFGPSVEQRAQASGRNEFVHRVEGKPQFSSGDRGLHRLNLWLRSPRKS